MTQCCVANRSLSVNKPKWVFLANESYTKCAVTTLSCGSVSMWDSVLRVVSWACSLAHMSDYTPCPQPGLSGSSFPLVISPVSAFLWTAHWFSPQQSFSTPATYQNHQGSFENAPHTHCIPNHQSQSLWHKTEIKTGHWEHEAWALDPWYSGSGEKRWWGRRPLKE